MKIAVINGNMRHGSTWHCLDLIRQELAKYAETEVKEFFLPRDMPHFCQGCYSCIQNGEATYPHAAAMHPIVNAITAADLVILTSPVYGLDVSGQMKALLDHLCYMWMSHRPNPRMFDKAGLTITTAAGVGQRHTTKTMRYSLRFWGVKKIFSFSKAVAAMKWSEIPARWQEKISKAASRLAAKIAKAVKNSDRLPNLLFRSVFFWMMAGMQKKNDWNGTDRNHWQNQGWLSGSRPF
jgi:multimeric flavodoxin WrbA